MKFVDIELAGWHEIKGLCYSYTHRNFFADSLTA